MHKITFFLLLMCSLGFSQTIQFNDPDLLNYLTSIGGSDNNGDGIFDEPIDLNNDGQIQYSEAEQVLSYRFNTLAHNIEDLGGFEHFINLEHLWVTTIDVPHLDFSPFQSLQSLRISLSSSTETYVFDNPLLTNFFLQNVGFDDPLFDLTNLPALEYVRIQSYHLTDNLIFGTHNNLEELLILGGQFSTLNLSGMPALKVLVIEDFLGDSLDISNCTLLEDFYFSYETSFSTLIGSDASSSLAEINFSLSDNNATEPSSLDLVFNNQSLLDVRIDGANSVSISNCTDISVLELFDVDESVEIDNCTFNYINFSLNSTLHLFNTTSDLIHLNNIDGLRRLIFQDFTTNTPLDLTTVRLESIALQGTSSLTELKIKNGDILDSFNSNSFSDIQVICADPEELILVENGYNDSDSEPIIHSDCTLGLDENDYEISGDILVDLGLGCTTNTNGSIFDLQFTITDGTNTDIFYPSNTNDYSFTLPEGSLVLNSEVVNSDLWTVDPSSININFPEDPNPYVQDFCISPATAFQDLEITIIPLNSAQPGFEADYKIIYKNKGTTILNGSIDFTFDDDVINLITSTPIVSAQSSGSLSWDYSQLLPFESRDINLTMLLNTPTDPDFPLNGDEVLTYTATINPIDSDEIPEDNTFALEQTVVNSFDPNDIRLLQGETITPDQVGEYVHYMIRFENLGTANAVNIVVENVLDMAKLDVSTFQPLYASHNFNTRITNENKVEFIFENIQLPFDDANNDGYVVYKIQTQPTLVLGDTFSNLAEIYFDFNEPIVTNNETTLVAEEILFTSDFIFGGISVFPNPAKTNLTINSKVDISAITVYDLNGRLLKVEQYNSNNQGYTLDINNLTPGIYFLEIQSGFNKQSIKFIKK